MKKINIGIVAHVDAGKTTVTENLLYFSKAIRKIGKVDSGNTQTDSMELERKRGITIRTSAISYNWKDFKINILDTPGHTDFISEVERSLSILDGAVLVISAVEGIQSSTKILFDTLRSLKIPTIIFINKIDRVGSNTKKLITDIKNTLSLNIAVINNAVNEGSRDASISECYSDDICEKLIETLSDIDSHVLEAYVNDISIDSKTIKEKVREHSYKSEIYPVLFGSAINGLGITNLLNAIVNYLPCSSGNFSSKLSGIVFKVDNSDLNDRKVFIRLFSGMISSRDSIDILNKSLSEKVKRISILVNCKTVDSKSVESGDIAILHGMKELKIGDIIGKVPIKIRNIKMAQPALKVKVKPSDKGLSIKLYEILKMIADEDPMLELETGEIEKDIYINLFGEIQMEILKSLIKDKYGIDISFSDMLTIYKETPVKAASAEAHFNEKMNPFRAEIGLKIEPLKNGSGFVYSSEVSTGYLPKAFQNAVKEAVYETKKQGLLGWEVTDAKVTLYHGEFDSVTSTPSEFRNLTPMVFMEALNNAQTNLLEPIYKFTIKTSKVSSGRAISDIKKMRGSILTFQNIGEYMIITGIVPVNTSKRYNIEISAYTEGKGVFVTKLCNYKKIPLKLGLIRKKTKIDPLNKTLYLLYKSGKLKCN